MKVTEAVFQRMDAHISSELAGAYDGCTANVVLANAEKMICVNLGALGLYGRYRGPKTNIEAESQWFSTCFPFDSGHSGLPSKAIAWPTCAA